VAAFKSTVVQTVHYVEVPEAESADFHDKVGAWLGLAVNTHVFDFKNVANIGESFSQEFQKFKSAALAKNCNVISVNFRPTVLDGLRRRGQEKMFGYIGGIVDGVQKRTTADTPAEIRSWIIKYLVAASRDAMNIMFNTTVAADENYRENLKDFAAIAFYCAALVNVKSSTFTATLRLYFDKEVLRGLTALTLRSSTVLIDDEVIDSTATELLNLIYGGAKSKINDDRGYNLPNAIPTLITPKAAAEARSNDFKQLTVIPFVTPIGAYYLEIDFGS
jgi:hypothetical protein